MAMTGGTPILVHTGKADYGAAGEIKLYVYYKYTQDTATNKSTVYVGMYVTPPSATYPIGPWSDFNGSYVGTKTNTFDGSIPYITEKKWIVENKSFTVDHDSEGNATATIYWKWGVNSPWGQCVNPSGYFTITLPQIARASTITSVDNANLGSTTKVVWTPKSKSFYYQVKLSMGDWSWRSAAITPNTTSANTYTTSVIPYEAAEQLSSDATEGTMEVRLGTFSDKLCTKQVGNVDKKTFTVTVPENSSTKPQVTMSLSPVNTEGKAWENLYVQGLSKVQASFEVDGKYGAEVSSYTMNVDGKNYSSPYLSNVLANDGTVTVTGHVTDSREFTNSDSKKITVIPYSKPSIVHASGETGVVCERCDSDGTPNDEGTYLHIKAKRSYSKMMSDGKQHNFAYMAYRYKKTVATSYPSEWNILLARTNAGTDTVDVKLNIFTDYTASYSVQLIVQDDVGKYDRHTFNIKGSAVDFNLKEGGGGAAFGKYSEANKTLEIASDWNIKIYGDRWVSLGLSSNATVPDAATYPFGRAKQGTCSYRVENGNHVYVQVNCGITWNSDSIVISNTAIPAEYSPPRDIFSMCACAGKYIVKLAVASGGHVLVSNVQNMASDTNTNSATITWLDGYIDYFI